MQESSVASRPRRSRLGCKTCRARKVKCDERPGGCANCERLQLICSSCNASSSDVSAQVREHYPGDSVHRMNFSDARAKRKRTYRSCIECRTSKARCSGDRPACMRCRQKLIDCVYEASSEPTWARRMASASADHENRDNLDGNLTPEAGNNHTIQRTSINPNQVCRVGETYPNSSNPPDSMSNSSSLSWLYSSELPRPEHIRILVEQYFANVHPLRCFAFIHKPLYLQRLDEGLAGSRERNALLHVICTLGALFYTAEHIDTIRALPHRSALSAGKEWAKTAHNLILAHLDDISVENLMVAVLLHDYELRMGNFAKAFMLSGITARMYQALQINLEYSTDILCKESEDAPSACDKESRRRLMWSCYIADSLVGSGVDQLTLVDEKDVKIQLPCNERMFLLQVPCITETIESGQVLRFIPQEFVPPNVADNMGTMAYFIRHISIRKRVLKYIKHLDEAKPPWLPDSEFVALDAECRHWYDSLPDSLKFTPTAIYTRKETGQVGALCLLHYAYQQTMCDLYRIGAPALYKLRAAFRFPPEQNDFLRRLQETLYGHGKTIALITVEAMRHGSKTPADTWIPSITYDSCRILLYHVTQLVDPAKESSKALMLETIPLLQSNIKALKMMRSLFAIAEPLSTAAETMLEKAGMGSDIVRRNIVPDDPYQSEPEEAERSTRQGTPAQSAPDYVLNPLSIYRMARKEIPERHAPEKRSSPRATTSQQAQQNKEQQFSNSINQDDDDALNTSFLPTEAEQASFDELQMFLTSDLGWSWQPADTAVGLGIEAAAGLPPWMPTL